MYVCGVTVYDLCHIGHARTFVNFDVIVRYLRYCGYDVTYVRNITDIDDKIIRRAGERNIPTKDLSEHFIEEMHKDFDALGIKRPDIEPKATQNIDVIIDLVKKLIDSDHAYVAENGDVCFRIESFPDYGRLSGQKLEELQAGARVEVAEGKRSPLDFVLWKMSKPGEPSWDSPWGKGRPGWHIECSVMSKHHLGDTFDIHAGGEDLIFPHHENEIAQSEAANGCTFARYWLHNGFITVDNEKMSKSLGNFFMVIDILEHYDPETLRFFIVSTHYRSPLDFSDARLTEAQKSLARLRQAQETLGELSEMLSAGPTAESLALREKVKELREAFMEAMRDDFNTALAISHMFALAKEINIYHKAVVDAGIKPDGKLVAMFNDVFAETCSIIGVLEKTAAPAAEEAGDSKEAELVEMLIAMRQDARKNKNYALADELRNKLNEIGIVLQDTPQGVKWSKQ